MSTKPWKIIVLLVGIFLAGGVDVVLAGHLHKYERSFLLDGYYGRQWASAYLRQGDPRSYTKPAGVNARAGTVYVTTGTSGVPAAGLSPPRPDLAAASVASGSLVCDVTSNTFRCSQVAAVTGAVLDTWSIAKP